MHLFRISLAVLVLMLSWACGAPDAVAGESAYEIDRSHSRLGFKVRHKMVSLVPGQFNTFSGTIHYDPENLSATRAKVEVDPASIDLRALIDDVMQPSSTAQPIAQQPQQQQHTACAKGLFSSPWETVGRRQLGGSGLSAAQD